MSSRIEDLTPEMQKRCLMFLRACELAGVKVRITHTFRSDDEQMHLYQQGREFVNGAWVVVHPGQIVTNAKPGETPHGKRKAFDFCFAGKTLEECYPPPTDPRWEKVGEIGEGLGLAWGGRWKSFKDRPHFEDPRWRAAA